MRDRRAPRAAKPVTATRPKVMGSSGSSISGIVRRGRRARNHTGCMARPDEDAVAQGSSLLPGASLAASPLEAAADPPGVAFSTPHALLSAQWMEAAVATESPLA